MKLTKNKISKIIKTKNQSYKKFNKKKNLSPFSVKNKYKNNNLNKKSLKLRKYKKTNSNKNKKKKKVKKKEKKRGGGPYSDEGYSYNPYATEDFTPISYDDQDIDLDAAEFGANYESNSDDERDAEESRKRILEESERQLEERQQAERQQAEQQLVQPILTKKEERERAREQAQREKAERLKQREEQKVQAQRQLAEQREAKRQAREQAQRQQAEQKKLEREERQAQREPVKQREREQRIADRAKAVESVSLQRKHILEQIANAERAKQLTDQLNAEREKEYERLKQERLAQQPETKLSSYSPEEGLDPNYFSQPPASPTPVAESSIATPISSPVATPISSPVATPVSSPLQPKFISTTRPAPPPPIELPPSMLDTELDASDKPLVLNPSKTNDGNKGTRKNSLLKSAKSAIGQVGTRAIAPFRRFTQRKSKDLEMKTIHSNDPPSIPLQESLPDSSPQLEPEIDSERLSSLNLSSRQPSNISLKSQLSGLSSPELSRRSSISEAACGAVPDMTETRISDEPLRSSSLFRDLAPGEGSRPHQNQSIELQDLAARSPPQVTPTVQPSDPPTVPFESVQAEPGRRSPRVSESLELQDTSLPRTRCGAVTNLGSISPPPTPPPRQLSSLDEAPSYPIIPGSMEMSIRGPAPETEEEPESARANSLFLELLDIINDEVPDINSERLQALINEAFIEGVDKMTDGDQLLNNAEKKLSELRKELRKDEQKARKQQEKEEKKVRKEGEKARKQQEKEDKKLRKEWEKEFKVREKRNKLLAFEEEIMEGLLSDSVKILGKEKELEENLESFAVILNNSILNKLDNNNQNFLINLEDKVSKTFNYKKLIKELDEEKVAEEIKKFDYNVLNPIFLAGNIPKNSLTYDYLVKNNDLKPWKKEMDKEDSKEKINISGGGKSIPVAVPITKVNPNLSIATASYLSPENQSQTDEISELLRITINKDFPVLNLAYFSEMEYKEEKDESLQIKLKFLGSNLNKSEVDLLKIIENFLEKMLEINLDDLKEESDKKNKIINTLQKLFDINTYTYLGIKKGVDKQKFQDARDILMDKSDKNQEDGKVSGRERAINSEKLRKEEEEKRKILLEKQRLENEKKEQELKDLGSEYGIKGGGVEDSDYQKIPYKDDINTGELILLNTNNNLNSNIIFGNFVDLDLFSGVILFLDKPLAINFDNIGEISIKLEYTPKFNEKLMDLCKQYFKDIILRIGLARPINNPCNPRNNDSKINRFLSKTISGYADTIQPTEDKVFKFGPSPEKDKLQQVKKTKEDQDREDQERNEKRLQQIEERSRQRKLQLSAREYLQNIREIQPGTFLPGEVIYNPTGSVGNSAVSSLTTLLSKNKPNFIPSEDKFAAPGTCAALSGPSCGALTSSDVSSKPTNFGSLACGALPLPDEDEALTNPQLNEEEFKKKITNFLTDIFQDNPKIIENFQNDHSPVDSVGIMENILSRLNNILDNNEEASEVGEEESEAPPEVVPEGAPEAASEGAPEAAAEVSDVAAEVPEEVEKEQPAETPATAEPPAEEEPPSEEEPPAPAPGEVPAVAPAVEEPPEAAEAPAEEEKPKKGGTVFEKLHANKELQIKNNNAVILSNNKFKGGAEKDVSTIISEIKNFINYFKSQIINLKPQTKSGTEIINNLIKIYKEFKTQQKNFEILTDKLDSKMKKIIKEITGQNYSVFTDYFAECKAQGTKQETIISYPFNYEQFKTLFFAPSTKIFKEYIFPSVKPSDQNVNLTGKLKEMYKEGGALKKLELLSNIYNRSKEPLKKIIEILDQKEDNPSNMDKEKPPEIVSEPEESEYGSAPPPLLEESDDQEDQEEPEEPEVTCGAPSGAACGASNISELAAIETVEHESEEETAKIKQQISDIRVKLNENPELQTALKDGNSETLSIDNKEKYDKIWSIPEKIKRSMKGGLFGQIISGIGTAAKLAAKGAEAVGQAAVKVGEGAVKVGETTVKGVRTGAKYVGEGAKAGYEVVKTGAKAGYDIGKTGAKYVEKGVKAGYDIGKTGAKYVEKGVKAGYDIGKTGAKYVGEGLKRGKNLTRRVGKSVSKGLETGTKFTRKIGKRIGEGIEKGKTLGKNYILNPAEKLASRTKSGLKYVGNKADHYILKPGEKAYNFTKRKAKAVGEMYTKTKKYIGESRVGKAATGAFTRVGKAYKWARGKPNKNHHRGRSRKHKNKRSWAQSAWNNAPSVGNNWFGSRSPIRGPRIVREGSSKTTNNYTINDSSGVELTNKNKQVPGAAVPGKAVPGATVPGAIVPGATVPGATSVAEEESGVRGFFNRTKKATGNMLRKTRRAAARKMGETRQILITREAKKLAEKGKMISTDKLGEFLKNNKALIESKVSKDKQTELIAISELTMNMTAEYKQKAMNLINSYTKETEDPEIKVYEDYLLLLLWSEKASEVRLSEEKAEEYLVMIKKILEAPDIVSSI